MKFPQFAKFALCSALGLVFSAGLRADPTMFVIPSLGPNAQFSPSGPGYNDNAVNAIYQGLSSLGTAGTPTFYNSLPNNASLPNTENIVTDFASWRGNASPATTFGPAFANELGNRLFFGFAIVRGAGDAQFSISQLSFDATSDNPDIAVSFGAGSFDYNARTWGVLFGPNGALGGGDDVIINDPGDNTRLVDAVFGRGSGLALAVLSSDPGATNQDRIDLFASSLPNYFIQGAYTLGSVTGNARTFFFAVPEPGTVVGGIAAVGLLAGMCCRRRFKAAGATPQAD